MRFWRSIPHSRDILALLATHLLLFTSLGMNVVLFPATLLHHGISETWIGVSSAIELLASITIAVFAARLAVRFGPMTVSRLLVIGFSGIILLLPIWQHFVWWLILIFLLGLTLFGTLIIFQGLYNQFVENRARGRYLAVMTIAVCLGLSLGPVLVKLFGALSYRTFVLSAVLALSSLLPTFFLGGRLRLFPPSRHVQLVYFLRRAPNLFVAKFVTDFMLTATFMLGVVYLVAYGHGAENAGLALSAFTLSTVLDYWIGMAVDRYSKLRLVSFSCLVVIGCMALLLKVAASLWMVLVLFFVLGLFIGMMHLSLSALLNNRFPSRSLVSANAAMQLVGSMGGIAGSLIVGGVLTSVGPHGYPLVMLGLAIGYLCVRWIWFRDRQD